MYGVHGMPADILRTSVKITRTADVYEAVCLTCGAALGKSRDAEPLCQADREHMRVKHDFVGEFVVTHHGSEK